MSVYAKNNGTWVPVGPAVTISAEGTPGAPELVDKDGNPDASGGSVIYFKPAPEGAAGPNLAHGASISPADGANVTVDQDTLEIAVSGTTPDTDYVVSVYGVNEAGRGEVSKTDAFQLNYNEATGGTENIVDNYNGSGEKWKVHTFASGQTFTVGSAPKKFRLLVVGGGGSHGNGVQDRGPGGGGGGGFVDDQNATIPTGGHLVTVGASSSGAASSLGSVLTVAGGGRGADGNTGGSKARGGTSGAPQSNIGGLNSPDSWSGGGGGGAGGPAGNSGNSAPSGGGAGASSNITGSNATYGRGGNGGKGIPPREMQHGAVGAVIVAYQIGTSTTRQIQQAEAEEAARQAGVEEGLQQGYNKAQEDLYTAVEEVKATVGDAADAIVDEVVSRVTAAATKTVTVEDFDIEADVEEEKEKNPNKGSGNNSGKGRSIRRGRRK